MLARISILLFVWLSGLVIYMLEGFGKSYLFNFEIYSTLFGIGLIVFFGSYMTQRSLIETVSSFRPILQLEEIKFQELKTRIKKYSYTIVPILILDLIFVFLLSDASKDIQKLMIEGFRFHLIWNIGFTFFMYLLISTGIWIGVSIWISIFLISKQPLNVELSQGMIEKFRGLTILALWFSLFYFISISIGTVVTFLGSPAVSIVNIILSPLMFFIAIGIIGVIYPFYNIHNTLIKLKKKELLKIENEYNRLQKELEVILSNEPELKFVGKTLAILGHISSQELKERNTKGAPEWPIDISFISKLLSLVLIPAIARISVEILNRFYLG